MLRQHKLQPAVAVLAGLCRAQRSAAAVGSAFCAPRHVAPNERVLLAALGCRTVSSALKSARVSLRKRFGQHLLKNADVVKNIVEAANIQPDEAVFEIGPGTGNMTVHMLERAKGVYAVELDPRLAEIVTRRVHGMGLSDKFFCTNADFLKVPLPAFDKLVANIPYQISSPVLTRLFTHTPVPKAAVIMFQLEFAERIVARPGTANYSKLSVNCQMLSHSVRMVMKIGKEQFRPPPKVDSAVVEIIPKGIPAGLDFARWDTFLRVAFGGKNKLLRSVLANKHVLAQLAANRAGAAARAGDGAAEAAVGRALPPRMPAEGRAVRWFCC